MSDTTKPYLDAYNTAKIIPTKLNISDWSDHYSQRWLLLKSLGITPAMVKGGSIFEVGAGTGVNSTYISSLNPASYDICDGNEKSIEALNDKINRELLDPTTTNIIAGDFLELNFEKKYDLVIAENCTIGQNEKFFTKLMGLVDTGGTLFITAISLLGILPDIMRKYIYLVLKNQNIDDDKIETILINIFTPHLSSINTNKFVLDWVYDNVILNHSEHAKNLEFCTIGNIIDSATTNNLAFMSSSSPNFTTDLRWFKHVPYNIATNNELIKECYFNRNTLFFDYRSDFNNLNSLDMNQKDSLLLEKYCGKAIKMVYEMQNEGNISKHNQYMELLLNIGEIMRSVSAKVSAAIDDYCIGIRSMTEGDINPKFTSFESFFGRATTYLTFTKSPDFTIINNGKNRNE